LTQSRKGAKKQSFKDNQNTNLRYNFIFYFKNLCDFATLRLKFPKNNFATLVRLGGGKI